jgi:hypothetical protein
MVVSAVLVVAAVVLAEFSVEQDQLLVERGPLSAADFHSSENPDCFSNRGLRLSNCQTSFRYAEEILRKNLDSSSVYR